MESPEPIENERFAKGVRFAMLAAIAVVIALIVTSTRREGITNPLSVPTANASLISAAPNYIAMAAPQGIAKFYLIDTTKQVICVYQLNGDKIRLVSARDFSRDTDIFDSSVEIPSMGGKPVIKSFEGGSGVDRQEAADYADGLKKLIDAVEKK